MKRTALPQAFVCFVLLAAAPAALPQDEASSGRIPEVAIGEPLRRIPVEEAHQGVAVDEAAIYVIDTRRIAKLDKRSGERLAAWDGSQDPAIIHFNDGVVVNGALYVSHSNYPGIPMTSSLELFDLETLEHIGTHSFGVRHGSLTWVDFHKGHWWACFAHYSKRGGYHDMDNRWTRIVRFDEQWRELGNWVLPASVLERFGRYSSSGGGWGPDDLLYIAEHDRKELYAMRLPKAGSTLELAAIVAYPCPGQAFAFDATGAQRLYGIDRSAKEVVVMENPKNLR